MINIKQLDPDKYKGIEYESVIKSDYFYDIVRKDNGFSIKLTKLTDCFIFTIKDQILSPWIVDGVAFGAYDENGDLIGFVEGFLEQWNNRYRITNICVFSEHNRNLGVGQHLIDRILIEAKKSGARMSVLETQNANVIAISFYEKNDFEIIGFDMYAYSNDGPKEHNIRIEMGRIL